VVVAVPDALRAGLDTGLDAVGAGRTSATISQLVAALSKGGHVQRPDPETDTAALLATAGLYRAGPGSTSGERISASDLSGLERQLASLGSPRDTDADLLCQLADQADSGSATERTTAAIVSEHSLAQFNRMDSGKPGCVAGTLDPRTAYYPSDVPAMDHPFVQVTWARASKDTKQRADAVGRLHTWLRSAAGQKFFTDDGYRGADTGGSAQPPPAGSLLATGDSDRTLEDVPLLSGTLTADDLDTDIRLYRAARDPADVLFVLDNSVSMRGPDWSIALSALQKSLSALGPKDDFGIITTPGPQLARLGSGAKDDASMAKKLAGLATGAGKADLAAALRSALTQVGDAGDKKTARLVVLITDDKAEAGITRGEGDQLVRDVRDGRAGQGITLVVVSLHNGCDGNTLDTQLADASRGVCVDRSDDPVDKLPVEVAKVGTGETP
jgi:Mg-chelatase subunit ChlD